MFIKETELLLLYFILIKGHMSKTSSVSDQMHRLNSGIFRIFELREWSLNLNSSDCRASKIIFGDT